ncbi:MAG: deoxyribodipyrimidine photo-lyase [Pseudomonadales bacterium]|nr:deoxyribodipyrimidine photo-lyase [Pseudomonadales bacterium]
MSNAVVYWFRRDLRTRDLPGLLAAAGSGHPVVPCYILDDDTPGEYRAGGASRWWLHHSLAHLQKALRNLGGQLVLRRGATARVLAELVEQCDARAVYCSRQYEPWADELEQQLHATLVERGVAFKRYPGALLFEPAAVQTQGGTPFRVFTPFWRQCQRLDEPRLPQPPARHVSWHPRPPAGDTLEDWALLPRSPDWANHWLELWSPGSHGAAQRLADFLGGPVADYSRGRDRPALAGTSRLSPHLHFGEISPRSVWHAARGLERAQPGCRQEVDKFLSELGWREFSYHLMHHFPAIAEQPFRKPFRHFPWRDNPEKLRAWQRGATGYPMVDAGMRELWHTGYMHNRVRMLVASFLTKHLLIHWRHGARWFHDTLVDADLANNSCGWQWVAGSGADAAPYFRIFNPVTQGEKFDGDGDYVRRWVAELARLPGRYLHRPWEAPADTLAAAGVTLGENYPLPVVEHKTAREAALAAYESIR